MRRGVIITLFMLLLLKGCSAPDGEGVNRSAGHEKAVITAFTTRIPADDAESQAIAIAQTIYPATREENAAGAIILAPQNPAIAFTAMNRITHMPVNAPLLYVGKDGSISEATLKEMARLRPDGVMQDGKVQVYAVGALHPSVIEIIKKKLKYKVREFREGNPLVLAELLDRWAAALKSDHADEVVISVLDHPDGIAHGLGAMGWNAHRGKGFAWVYKNSIPEETRRILNRRFGGAYMYLTGGSDIISDAVAKELARYGFVRRIAGPDAYATNVINAGYKDFGRNFGWWWGWRPRDFGWGISQSGHNFIIGNARDLLGIIPAAVLGHMGKHGPILIVERDRIPKRVHDYLASVRPPPKSPDDTILNHGWIIGDLPQVSLKTQRELDLLLSPKDTEAAEEITSEGERDKKPQRAHADKDKRTRLQQIKSRWRSSRENRKRSKD